MSITHQTGGTSAKKRRAKQRRAPFTVYDGYPVYRWKSEAVTVIDHMPSRWSAIHRGMVEAINAAIPQGGPPVIYQAGDHRMCDSFDFSTPDPGVIHICDKATVTEAATAYTKLQNMRIIGGIVSIPDAWMDAYGASEGPRVSCHELLHAMLHIADRTQGEPDRDSCVLGFSPVPGAWDKAAFEAVYG